MPAMPVMPATPATPTTPTTPTTNERADQSSTVLAQKEPAKNRPEVPPELDFATSDVLLETLNVLVTLIENARSDLRGHSAHVARLARKIAEHMGFARPEVNALLASAYLHDVAKAGKYHLTALNVAQYENPRSTAQKVYANPYRLLENVRLAPQTVAALEGMYEKFDGTGLPHQKAGKEIPLFARLLAVCDTFVDLTVNANNPFGRILKPGEACEVLSRYKGSIFDPSLVDLLRVTVTGDDVRARILADRPVALLVDPDPEETMVLELRMAEQGFEVRVARSAEQALKMLESSEIEIVVAEIELGSAQPDGLWLLNEARKADWGRNLPWLVLSRRQGRTDAEAAFALGVVDYVPKPAPEDVLVAKLKQALERGGTARAQRGVAGSLREMGIPDLVQILFYGRKSGALLLRKGPDNGALYFAEGMVVHAVWGNLSGADAFYGLLRLREGEFSFDPSGRTDKVTINESPESLLLEGMRRMDEG